MEVVELAITKARSILLDGSEGVTKKPGRPFEYPLVVPKKTSPSLKVTLSFIPGILFAACSASSWDLVRVGSPAKLLT